MGRSIGERGGVAGQCLEIVFLSALLPQAATEVPRIFLGAAVYATGGDVKLVLHLLNFPLKPSPSPFTGPQPSFHDELAVSLNNPLSRTPPSQPFHLGNIVGLPTNNLHHGPRIFIW